MTTSSPVTRRLGDGGEQVAGVVVEPVDDLHAGAVG